MSLRFSLSWSTERVAFTATAAPAVLEDIVDKIFAEVMQSLFLCCSRNIYFSLGESQRVNVMPLISNASQCLLHLRSGAYVPSSSALVAVAKGLISRLWASKSPSAAPATALERDAVKSNVDAVYVRCM